MCGLLSSDILKKRLRDQGRLYSRGMHARGGVPREPHMLTQAADRIEELEAALKDLINDCINFDGGKLTDSVIADANKTLFGRIVHDIK